MDASCSNDAWYKGEIMGDIIYADNAATTKLDKLAFEAMSSWLLDEYGNASQSYTFARNPKKSIAEARAVIATCIGAEPEEIFFTSGGTESDNWAIKGTLCAEGCSSIATSSVEHHAVLNACASVEKLGHNVFYIPVDAKGIVSLSCLREHLSCMSVKLVSVMLANNEIGTIEPIRELTSLAHDYGALVHTDAVQAVGHIPINVKDLQVDMLSASGHKFNSPKGIGFLYIKKGTSIKPYMDGGAQEFGLRAGTENVPAIVAMAIALKNNCSEMEKVTEKLTRMESIFFQTLNQGNVDYIKNGADNKVPGNINLSIKGVSGEMLLHRLDLKKIFISTGSACDSKNMQISHVIQAIGVPADYAEGTIRVSFGKNNKESDAYAVASAIVDILKR